MFSLYLQRQEGDRRLLFLKTRDRHVPQGAGALALHFRVKPETIVLRSGPIALDRVGDRFVFPARFVAGWKYTLTVDGERQPRDKVEAKASEPTGTPLQPSHPLHVYADTKMQERYDFLAHGKEPPYLRTVYSWQQRRDWKSNVKRRFSLSDDDSRLMAYKQRPEKYMAVGRGVYSRTHPLRLVPFDDAEAEAIVRERHVRGHDRKNRMRAVLSRYYKHRGICGIIDRVLGECNVCAEMSENIKVPTMAIMTQRPHELIMFDLFFMPFPTSEGYTCVLLVKDHFTKFLWAAPMRGKNAQPIADFMWTLFSDGRPCPERWHCDNGSEFVNHLMHEVIGLLRARNTHGRPRHPQTQGSIERANGTIKRKLIAWCKQEQPLRLDGQDVVDWLPKLTELVRNENDMPTKLYGIDPFFLQFNTPRALGEGGVHPTPAQVEEIRLHCVRCQEAYAGKINKFPDYAPTFEIGDIVNVWASPTALKAGKALTTWSAKGVVEENQRGHSNYYRVRWMTPGLHTMRNRDNTVPGTSHSAVAGSLSMWLYRGHLKRVPTVASGESDIFIDSEGYALLVLFRFPNGSFNYVFVSGPYERQEFLCVNESDDLTTSCWRVPYATWVHNSIHGLPLHTPYTGTTGTEPPQVVTPAKKRARNRRSPASTRATKAATLPRGSTAAPRTPSRTAAPGAVPVAPSKPPRPCMYRACNISLLDDDNLMMECPSPMCITSGHKACYREYVTERCDTGTILANDLPHSYMCEDCVEERLNKKSLYPSRINVKERFPKLADRCAYGVECLYVHNDDSEEQKGDELHPCEYDELGLQTRCTAVGHTNCFTHYLERTYTLDENFFAGLREWGWATFACPHCVHASAPEILRSCVADLDEAQSFTPFWGFPMKSMDDGYPYHVPPRRDQAPAPRDTQEDSATPVIPNRRQIEPNRKSTTHPFKCAVFGCVW